LLQACELAFALSQRGLQPVSFNGVFIHLIYFSRFIVTELMTPASATESTGYVGPSLPEPVEPKKNACCGS
jgi:hypothetical protein